MSSTQHQGVGVGRTAVGIVPVFVGNPSGRRNSRFSRTGWVAGVRDSFRRLPDGRRRIADAAVGERRRISLLVNRGQRTAVCDAGSDRGERRPRGDVLRTRGFARSSAFIPTPVPAGVVLQNLQAGFQIAPGEAISLEVSR
jgi:hypothetical protein